MKRTINVGSGSSAEANLQLSELLSKPGGLEKFASEELPKFIREERDYEGFARDMLLTHTVTADDLILIDGEPYKQYAKDLNSWASYFGVDVDIPVNRIEGSTVNCGILTLASADQRIALKRLKVERYDYLERVRNLSAQTIAKIEDFRLIALMENMLQGEGTAIAPTNESQIIKTADTELTKNHLVDLKSVIDGNNIPISTFLMSPKRQNDMLKWADDQIDQLTQREMMETGVKFKIWGDVSIRTSKIINDNHVYCAAEAQFFGAMPILEDLQTKLTETDHHLESGLFVYEFVGMILFNHKAVSKLILGFVENDAQIHAPNLSAEAGVYSGKTK